jgi:hypothetical protein
MRTTYPVISIGGIDYQLEICDNDILVINVDQSIVDEVNHFDKIWIDGFATIREMILKDHGWCCDINHLEDIREEAYEIMGWIIADSWDEVINVMS